MDLIASVKDAFERVTKRQKLYHSIPQDVIDGIEETVSRIRLDNGELLEPEAALTELRSKIDSLQGSQKEMNMSLSKYEKVLEKSCHLDLSRVCRSIDFDVRLVNKVLVDHFYREGVFELGDCLVKEAGEEVDTEVRSQFVEIYQIVESMKLRNIEPAMRWISANRGKLKQNGLEMELKLVSLKYCEMLRKQMCNNALMFAKTHFQKYVSVDMEEIKRLATAMLWVGKLEKCPYSEMFSSSNWDNVSNELTKEFFHLLDKPSNSPLAVVLSAGLESLPTLLKLVRLMDLTKQEWQAVKQLPVPLELGNEFQFHSVFVCPIQMSFLSCTDLSCSMQTIILLKLIKQKKFDMISTLKDAFDKVSKRQKVYHSVSAVVFDRACEVILEALFRIQLDSNGLLEASSVFTELKGKLDSLLPTVQIQGSQKEMNFSFREYEKVLERSFHPDISRACRNVDFDIDLVNQVLVHYFYRQGLFEVGDSLVKEAEVEVESEIRSQSLEIHRLRESIKHGNIEPGMRWISANRGKLKQSGSKLELELVSLRYCEMLREGNQSDALKYARTHFPQYASHNMKYVNKLISAVLWVRKPEKSPYAEMVSSLSCENIAKELTKQYYHLLDQSSNSPLAVVLSAGLETLPTRLKMGDVMGLKKGGWEAMKELPFPRELGNEYQFHSVFVCPVSRDESSQENPPMMLPCRHVLCKKSIMRLGKNCHTRRFKCPFCPALTFAAACKKLYF